MRLITLGSFSLLLFALVGCGDDATIDAGCPDYPAIGGTCSNDGLMCPFDDPPCGGVTIQCQGGVWVQSSHTDPGPACLDAGTTDAATDASVDAGSVDAGSVDAGRPTPADWQLPVGHFEPAQISLDIIAPRPDVTNASHYGRAYPGIAWRAPVSVLGGAWPFRYELVTAPSGMTLGETYGEPDYGILVWAVPSTTGAPQEVAVRVTDQEGTSATVSWNIEVTTGGFLFLDAVAGSDETGDGSIDSPFRTMAAWLGTSRRDDTYRRYHIYYRAGTYHTKWDYEPGFTARGVVTMAFKPGVHLAYPGEEVIFDFSPDGAEMTGGKFVFGGGNDDIFFHGINWRGVGSQPDRSWLQGATMNDGLQRANIFECEFSNQLGPGVTGQNPAWFFFGNTHSNVRTRDISFSHNTITGLDAYMLIESYTVDRMVVESNTVRDTVGGLNRLAYFKVGTTRVSVRNNTGVRGNEATLVEVDSAEYQYDEIETCWNNWRVESDAYPLLWYGASTTAELGRIFTYRNTLSGSYIRHMKSAGGGPVWYQHNVRQYVGGVDGIEDVSPTFMVTGLDTDLAATGGLVDSSTNQLTGSQRGMYLGVMGHEVN